MIGVLALQGDVREHLAALAAIGASARPVRRRHELDGLTGLIIPGGESTTIGRLLVLYDLLEPIRERAAAARLAIYGTCAGLILLAREIEGSDQPRLGLLDVTVRRNAYGRQVDSFDTLIEVPTLGPEPLEAAFIRAPLITRTGNSVEVMARHGGHPVLVRRGSLLASSFHPELTGDLRVHRYFAEHLAGERIGVGPLR